MSDTSITAEHERWCDYPHEWRYAAQGRRAFAWCGNSINGGNVVVGVYFDKDDPDEGATLLSGDSQ